MCVCFFYARMMPACFKILLPAYFDWFDDICFAFDYRPNKQKIPVSTCLVFFKGWNITLQCHLNKRWQWVEPVFYHRQFSTDINQKGWVVECPADDIQIQMRKTGASKGWTMIHDIHFRRSYNKINTQTEQNKKNI